MGFYSLKPSVVLNEDKIAYVLDEVFRRVAESILDRSEQLG
jgi:hypothetical protein